MMFYMLNCRYNRVQNNVNDALNFEQIFSTSENKSCNLRISLLLYLCFAKLGEIGLLQAPAYQVMVASLPG